MKDMINEEIDFLNQFESLSSSKSLIHSFENNFDINYKSSLIKGKLLFKYLFSRMGNDSFFQWMKEFIHSNQEKSLNANRLIESLPFEIMSDLKSWIYQAGFPLITLEETGIQNLFKFSQKRFYSHFPLVHDTEKWNISISTINSAGGTTRIEFNVIPLILNLKELYSNPIEVNRWMLVQNENLMPNIVNYPPNLWEEIMKEIENGSFKDSEKIKLLNDAFILSKSGELNIKYVRSYSIDFSCSNCLIL
jgi:hypothetical protein